MSTEARVVFCDDIRREDNGKAILIGVYTGDLIPGVLPTNLPLSLWIDIRDVPLGHHNLVIKVELPGGEKISVPGQLDVEEVDKPITLMFVGMPAQINAPGLIRVLVDISGTEVVAGQLTVVAPAQLQPNAS